MCYAQTVLYKPADPRVSGVTVRRVTSGHLTSQGSAEGSDVIRASSSCKRVTSRIKTTLNTVNCLTLRRHPLTCPYPPCLMSAKHWSWGYFFTDGLFFRNNNSFKNAWCIACLNHEKELLRQADIISAAVGGTYEPNRTYAEREAEGIVLFLHPGDDAQDHLWTSYSS